MNQEKVSTGLASRLENANASDLVDVIVELEVPAPGENNITATMAQFKVSSAPVTGSIEQMGGEVLGSAWINSTVRARIPARGVKRLAAVRGVGRIDLPHKLDLEVR